VKNIDFNVIKFLVIFIFLLEGFYLYVGITSKGGKLFSPFLSKYANFPEWITIIIAGFSKFFLRIAGYSVYQTETANITIAGSRGVTLAWGCLGAGAISLWIAFIIAHKCSTRYKLKWITAGVLFIFLVNTFRVMMIALSNYHHWIFFQNFNAHTSFNTITYIIVLLLMWFFVRNYNRAKHKTQRNSGSIMKNVL